MLLGRSLPTERNPCPFRGCDRRRLLSAVREVLLIALDQRMQPLPIGRRSLVAVGCCTVVGAVIGQIDCLDRCSSHTVAVANAPSHQRVSNRLAQLIPPAKERGHPFRGSSQSTRGTIRIPEPLRLRARLAGAGAV